jgi:hypothetical protein
MVYISSLFLNALPLSTVSRGRPIPEGSISYRWSYSYLVSLLCLWTYSLRLCFDLNFGHILEKHGCPDWSVVNWPIRVDPCFKSFYMSIFLMNFLYNIITIINICILISPLICCATWSHCDHAWMTHHSVELGVSKSIFVLKKSEINWKNDNATPQQ